MVALPERGGASVSPSSSKSKFGGKKSGKSAVLALLGFAAAFVVACELRLGFDISTSLSSLGAACPCSDEAAGSGAPWRRHALDCRGGNKDGGGGGKGRPKRGIPRQIFQSFKTPYSDLPPNMRNATLSWKDLNPTWTYRYFSDADSLEYVLKWGNPKFIERYNSTNSGAGKCDLWRALVVHREGGVYADIDTTLLEPLDSFILDSDDGFSGLTERGELNQWLMAYAPGHPLMGRLIDYALDDKNPGRYTGEGGIYAGPQALHAAAAQVFGPPEGIPMRLFNFTPGTHWSHDLVAGNAREDAKYNIRVVEGDGFGWRVKFKYPGYFSDLRAEGVDHWKWLSHVDITLGGGKKGGGGPIILNALGNKQKRKAGQRV